MVASRRYSPGAKLYGLLKCFHFSTKTSIARSPNRRRGSVPGSPKISAGFDKNLTNAEETIPGLAPS